MVKEVVDRILIGQIRPAVVLFVLLTVVTGVAYPLAVTGIATIAFPEQSAGSLIVRDGKPIGSRLIGQEVGGEIPDPRHPGRRPGLGRKDPTPGQDAQTNKGQAAPQEPAAASIAHWISSLACNNSDCGMVSPSA